MYRPGPAAVGPQGIAGKVFLVFEDLLSVDRCLEGLEGLKHQLAAEFLLLSLVKSRVAQRMRYGDRRNDPVRAYCQ